MFTSVNLIPARRMRWLPSRAFLEALFKYLGVEKAWSAAVYSKPQLWPTDPSEPEELFAMNVSTRGLLFLIENRQKRHVVSANLKCEHWGERLFDEAFRTYVEKNTNERCMPCSVGITVGPSSFPDWHHEKTQASSWFTLDLSSDGLPKRPAEFLDLFTQTKPVVELKAFLEQTTGLEWQGLLDMSW